LCVCVLCVALWLWVWGCSNFYLSILLSDWFLTAPPVRSPLSFTLPYSSFGDNMSFLFPTSTFEGKFPFPASWSPQWSLLFGQSVTPPRWHDSCTAKVLCFQEELGNSKVIAAENGHFLLKWTENCQSQDWSNSTILLWIS
jgi:hypothetical protein